MRRYTPYLITLTTASVCTLIFFGIIVPQIDYAIKNPQPIDFISFILASVMALTVSLLLYYIRCNTPMRGLR